MDRVRVLSPALSGAAHAAAAGILVFVPLFTADRLPAPPSFHHVAHAGGGPVVRLGGGGVSGVGVSQPRVARPPTPARHVLPLERMLPEGITLDLGEAGPAGIGDGPYEGPGPCLLDCDSGPGPLGAAPPASIEPVRSVRRMPVGGDIREPVKVRHVDPVYPPLAVAARVQGAVVLQCVITAEGTVSEIAIVSGHVLLNDAAVAAVSRWRYRPTLLNGEPVSVILTVTVSFALR
jgi:protein TonB